MIWATTVSLLSLLPINQLSLLETLHFSVGNSRLFDDTGPKTADRVMRHPVFQQSHSPTEEV